MLTGITWKSVPNFTQYGQELRPVRVGIDLLSPTVKCSGPGSVVVIATGYGLGGPKIESRWGARFSTPFQTQPLVQWVPGLCRG